MSVSRYTLSMFALLAGIEISGVAGQPAPSPAPILKLTASVSEAKYCDTDAEIYTEELSLSTQYENTSDEPLPLVIGSEAVSRVVAAATQSDLTIGKLELEMNLESYPAGTDASAILGEDLRREKKVVIAPGRSIRSIIQVSIPIRRVLSRNIPGTVAPGKHVLEVQLAIKSPKPPHSRVERTEFRWLTANSQPIRFDAPTDPHVRNCGN